MTHIYINKTKNNPVQTWLWLDSHTILLSHQHRVKNMHWNCWLSMVGDQFQIALSLICRRVQGSSCDVLQGQNKALATAAAHNHASTWIPTAGATVVCYPNCSNDQNTTRYLGKKKRQTKSTLPPPPINFLSVAFPKRKQVIYTYIYTHTGRAQDYGQLLGWQQWGCDNTRCQKEPLCFSSPLLHTIWRPLLPRWHLRERERRAREMFSAFSGRFG